MSFIVELIKELYKYYESDIIFRRNSVDTENRLRICAEIEERARIEKKKFEKNLTENTDDNKITEIVIEKTEHAIALISSEYNFVCCVGLK